MNRRQLLVLVLVLLALAGVLLAAACGGDSTKPEPTMAIINPEASTAIIDPAIWDALETETAVDVLISLRELDLPMSQLTTELRRQHAADIQATVLSILTENDFVLAIQYEISASLAGRVTRSGMEKLAVHPGVVGIGLDAPGTYDE